MESNTQGPPEAQTNEKPDTASDHNNSMITAVSADRDMETSPLTSPMIHRKPSGNRERERERENPAAKFQGVVEGKSQELIKLMKEIVETDGLDEVEDSALEKFVDEQTKGIQNNSFKWKTLIDMSESIFNEYSKEMEGISKEFDELNKEFLIWQESAYVLDSERVAKRLGQQEEWINSKEAYLNHTRNELVRSAELIENAITNLNPLEKSTSNINPTP